MSLQRWVRHDGLLTTDPAGVWVLACDAEAEVARLRVALGRLISAAELYAADQSKADDPRCGLSQPITVAEAEELNAALLAAGDALAKPEQEGGK